MYKITVTHKTGLRSVGEADTAEETFGMTVLVLTALGEKKPHILNGRSQGIGGRRAEGMVQCRLRDRGRQDRLIEANAAFALGSMHSSAGHLPASDKHPLSDARRGRPCALRGDIRTSTREWKRSGRGRTHRR